MREYEDRRQIEKFYEQARKNIKAQIEAKGVSTKGSVKGTAISEIVAILDKEMEINIAEELVNARKAIRAYCDLHYENHKLKAEIEENKIKVEQLQAVEALTTLITDEVLRNAIVAYNAIAGSKFVNREYAKEITIAYIQSKGREDMENVLFEKTGEQI